ncbi:Pre-mRNA-splicing factor cwf16 [Coemansia guatemalensis]|uniref:Splicing factor YJU2 n=1 Tax=Coemansia guatemalensis TaxID=2761395 RepID=A0A9W8I3B6_9FUNG|nr:Pre-mRNA-splicing factor cwf16 [Coemansia guatemalensis]
MAERKVLNKYIPPDFDPAKIPRLRLGKNRQIKVRLMSPFSMRCSTCGQWIGKGTKFNARKEPVEGEKFHSIQIFRFYIRCQRCAAEITFKTDPENNNYLAEEGAQRNFEPWREEKELNEKMQKEKEEEEEDDPIKALENRTEQSRREMEIMDTLDEIRLLNARGERVATSGDAMKEAVEAKKLEEQSLLEEDERLAREAFSTVGGRRIKRAREEDAVEREHEIKQAVTGNRMATRKPDALSRALLGVKSVKEKPAVPEEKEEEQESPEATTLSGMLGAYASDSD